MYGKQYENILTFGCIDERVKRSRRIHVGQSRVLTVRTERGIFTWNLLKTGVFSVQMKPLKIDLNKNKNSVRHKMRLKRGWY